jgi:hypothetical protein
MGDEVKIRESGMREESFWLPRQFCRCRSPLQALRAGFAFSPHERFALKPYHYGLTLRTGKGDKMKKLLVATLLLNVFTMSGCMGLMHGDHHSNHMSGHQGTQQPSADEARPSDGSHSH